MRVPRVWTESLGAAGRGTTCGPGEKYPVRLGKKYPVRPVRDSDMPVGEEGEDDRTLSSERAASERGQREAEREP